MISKMQEYNKVQGLGRQGLHDAKRPPGAAEAHPPRAAPRGGGDGEEGRR